LKAISIAESLPSHPFRDEFPASRSNFYEIGFETAARSTFDSDIEAIELLELARRTENAVIVEGRKR
jgi:hypothetical protein